MDSCEFPLTTVSLGQFLPTSSWQNNIFLLIKKVSLKDVLILLLLCFFREIFPYLVVIIGIENVVVITKSVVSTSIELDVKYRVASGMDFLV